MSILENPFQSVFDDGTNEINNLGFSSSPEILLDYHYWHNAIDYFVWLLKIFYSTPDEIQKKKFNVRNIFDNYLDGCILSKEKIKNDFEEPNRDQKKITDDLKRGWYNELAYLYPLKDSTLGISFREIADNETITNTRMTFLSWKIAEAYYANYFYLRSLSQCGKHDINLPHHLATLKAFKGSVLPIIKGNLWNFPFSMEYKNDKNRVFKSSLTLKKHLKYKYTKHPRMPQLLPLEIEKEIDSIFKKRAEEKGFSHYTIFDFLLEFRIWANYLDIDNLLSLYGNGYKGYLDQNLSVISFFIWGITEIVYISIYGEELYLEELQKFYSLFVKNKSHIKDDFIYTSIYQRMRIYKIRGIISSEIRISSLINENEIK